MTPTEALVCQRGQFEWSLWTAPPASTLRFRAWQEGCARRICGGGYFDRWHESWDDAEAAWFEALLEEQDVDILAWAMGTADVPARWRGEMMRRLQSTDYIKHPNA